MSEQILNYLKAVQDHHKAAQHVAKLCQRGEACFSALSKLRDAGGQSGLTPPQDSPGAEEVNKAAAALKAAATSVKQHWDGLQENDRLGLVDPHGKPHVPPKV